MSTYDVRVHNLLKNTLAGGYSYTVRWKVAGQSFRETFATRALAESYRAKLVTAQREGVAFDEASGLPEPMARHLYTRSWYEHCIEYVDMMWPRSSPKHRKGIAETLATVTPLMASTDRGLPSAKVLRTALYGWSFNKLKRDGGEPPADVTAALTWIERNTVPLTALTDAALVRKMLDQLSLKLDGSAAAAATVGRKRAVLSGVLRYAVELRRLDAHPFTHVSWIAPRAEEHVDRRVVVNPDQARLLLAAVAASMPELEAFFATMYHCALRPEEALNLCDDEYERPKRKGGWGWFHLSGATVAVGNDWTDDGSSVDRRHLKHRPKKATRNVPVNPECAGILTRHIDKYGTGPEGRLFVSRRGPGGVLVPTAGQPIPTNSYAKAWRDARDKALTPAQVKSPLAGRPYDLRHACVSLWLNAGVQAPQVAEWAGHSVNVLMKVYAKCVDGQEEAARHRIEAALGRPATTRRPRQKS